MTDAIRQHNYLKQRYHMLIGYTGAISTMIGLLLLVPILVVLFYQDEVVHVVGFLLAGLPLLGLGLLTWYFFKPTGINHLSLQEGAVIVVMTWLIAILFGTIPFIRISELSFLQAIFESTSGWTTTGLSVVDVTEAPHIILFFRSLIQLAGGAGFAIIALSAITGSFSAGLVSAEGRTDQLAPHVRHSANIVLTIYGGYVIIGTIALHLAGMTWFDAINHAFTALSTGGFSTKTASIGYWDSPRIEAVVLVLMFLGTTNFLIVYAILRGKFRTALRSGELHVLVTLLTVGTGLMLIFVSAQVYPNMDKAVRVAIFEVTSAITTTGFATIDYHILPSFGWLILIVLMLIGGGTGSTAGGMKQLRLYILYKAIVWEVKKSFLPRHIMNEPIIWQGTQHTLLNDRQVRQTAVFVGTYLVLFLIGSGLMMIHGYSMEESLFEFASTLGTVGLSVGVTSADMPETLLGIQSMGMLLGRLEIFTVFVGSIKFLIDLKTLIAGRN